MLSTSWRRSAGPARSHRVAATHRQDLLLQTCACLTANHPECYLIVLLIDERPEEVTDMQRSVKARSYLDLRRARRRATSRSRRW